MIQPHGASARLIAFQLLLGHFGHRARMAWCQCVNGVAQPRSIGCILAEMQTRKPLFPGCDPGMELEHTILRYIKIWCQERRTPRDY